MLTDEQKQETVAAYARQTMGTANYHRWNPLFRNILATDGAKLLADTCGAWWLLDAIASHIVTSAKVRREPFQVWTLAPITNGGAMLRATDGDKGTGPVELAAQDIEHTDFPRCMLPFTLWAERSGDGLVIMLPAER